MLGKNGDVNCFNPVRPTRVENGRVPISKTIPTASRLALYGIPDGPGVFSCCRHDETACTPC
jgi:hypothetical protein